MLDHEVKERLQEIVTEKVANGEPFTAYDITMQLRAENYWVRHEHARSRVHEMYQDGEMPGYSRYLASKGGPVPAWEYCPAGSHLAMAGIARLGLCPSLPPGLLAPSGARTYRAVRTRGAVLTPGGGMAVPVDRRATVCIPARLVRQVALQPGDRVSVFVDASHSQLVVRPGPAADSSDDRPARRYTVDRYWNIRITQSTQVRAGLQGMRRQILALTDELIVTAA